MTTRQDTIRAIAPSTTPLDSRWSSATLASILADRSAAASAQRPWWRRTRRRAVVAAVVGLFTITAGTAVAAAATTSTDAVRAVLTHFTDEPHVDGGLGRLNDPRLVAKFETRRGLFAFWVARSSSGELCYASSDGTWDGIGSPTTDELEYGCGDVALVSHADPQRIVELSGIDQLGGFFTDDDGGPLIYGISPFSDAVSVRVHADGIDRTLPIRESSHGFGAALPAAGSVRSVTLTFAGPDGRTLGRSRWVAPRG